MKLQQVLLFRQRAPWLCGPKGSPTRFELRFVNCFVYARTALGIQTVCWNSCCVCSCVCVGLEVGHLCWKLFSYDGCGLGVGHVFGKLVCVHCCWLGDWTFTLEIIVQCWDWTDDLTFTMEVFFIVSWVWAGNLTILDIVFCMLGHGLGIVDSISELCCACWDWAWNWTFYLEVRLCTSTCMFVLGLGLNVPFGNYFEIVV